MEFSRNPRVKIRQWEVLGQVAGSAEDRHIKIEEAVGEGPSSPLSIEVPVGARGRPGTSFRSLAGGMTMTNERTRRDFLSDVGRGTLIAALGGGAAQELGLGLASAHAGDARDRLTFGPREALVGLMQETPMERLVPVLIETMKQGTSLRDLVAAGALANARTFGGEDYIGFHTMMAMAPALHMSGELPEARRALPVIKVLYRNTQRIAEFGGPSKEVLHTVRPGSGDAESLREAVRARQMEQADSTFASLAQGEPRDALIAALLAVQDETEVHRTVLPYRSWDLLGLIGMEHAQTLLRQSVHYCVKNERNGPGAVVNSGPRVVLPRLFEKFGLAKKTPGRREADDKWVDDFSRTVFEGTAEHAAEATAAALSEGFAPSVVGEALALAANQLVLRDMGRYGNQIQPGKPAGSVHGDSIGVHACDSTNAWRHLALAADPRNTFACLILGAYQVARDRVDRGGDFLTWKPRPWGEDLESVRPAAPAEMLGALHEAVRGNEQARACALTYRLCETSVDPNDIFQVLLGYACSEDGALHAEKFYRTVREEFTETRPAFRSRHLVALARVTASEYGRPAPGFAEAKERLGA